MYTIILHDGTQLEDLELNGNNFIAQGIIEDSVFADNLATVTISNGTTTETYTDMTLVVNRVEDGCSWFVLREKSEQEKAMERIYTMLTTNENSITDIQMALAEMYEIMLTGVFNYG